MLGKKGYWLPWSIDLALYSLIFFHIGHLLNKYDIINKLMERKYLYFVLSPIWVYMIYSGSMEIAVRKYEPFGLVILGAISGILIMYMFSDSISNRIGKIGNKLVEMISSSTIYILIIHSLFQGKILTMIKEVGLDSKNIFNFTITLIIQIIAGALVSYVVKFIVSIKNKKKIETRIKEKA